MHEMAEKASALERLVPGSSLTCSHCRRSSRRSTGRSSSRSGGSSSSASGSAAGGGGGGGRRGIIAVRLHSCTCQNW